MASEELPSPVSGLFLEVSFRRLLATCEDIVAGTSIARPDLVGTWRRSPVFHHYIETLQEQLADLQASAGSRMPSPLLGRYGAHVEALARQLERPDLPAFCSSAMTPQLQPQRDGMGQEGGAAAATARAAAAAALQPPAAVGRLPPRAPPVVTPPRPAAVPPPVAVAHNPRLPVAAAPAVEARHPAGAGAGAAAASTQRPTAAPGSRLHTQQQLHEDLTDDLAGLAARLKSNTLAMEGKLREREGLLDSTETALDKSLRKTKESNVQATQIHRKGRTNFCLTCLIMMVVGLMFAAMYVFIKFTRFAGYRAAAPVPAAGPLAPVPADGVAQGPLLAPDEIPVYEQHYDL